MENGNAEWSRSTSGQLSRARPDPTAPHCPAASGSGRTSPPLLSGRQSDGFCGFVGCGLRDPRPPLLTAGWSGRCRGRGGGLAAFARGRYLLTTSQPFMYSYRPVLYLFFVAAGADTARERCRDEGMGECGFQLVEPSQRVQDKARLARLGTETV